MQNSVPIIYPYYSKWDTPDLTNRFQKAVFNGRTTKVKQLIAEGENVYASTNKDEISLYLAIARGHQTIVHEILDIYVDDLHFVRQYFQIRHTIEWTQRPVFIAHGSDHISLVKRLSKGMEILFDHRNMDKTHGMIILLKSTANERELLWLSPNNHEDDMQIARIMECIWADGVIDMCHEGHWGRTVLDVAAIRNQPEIYFRLHSLIRPEPEKQIEHFLHLCNYQQDKVGFFKNLMGKTGDQFDLGDVLSKTVSVLVLPAYHDQIEVFQYFLESLANKRKTVMADILNNCKVSDNSTVMETIVWADQKEFVEQCLVRFKPDLLLIGANNETVLQSLIRQKPSEFMTKYIIENFDEFLASGMEYKIVKRLIKGNWVNAVKSLYERYASCRCLLFRSSRKGVKCLLNIIDKCYYDMANYLIDAHRLDLTYSDDVTQLLLYCAFVQRSKAVLETLLSLPAADSLKITGPEHYFKSPLYVALKFRHLKNFQLLLDNVKNLEGLRDLREDNGETLLTAAIWFKENPVNEAPFVYVEEERASLEILDSSDDEDESERKRVHNERLMTSSGPYKDPIMPVSFFAEQRLEVNRIFSYLLHDVGLDYGCITTDGETLLHLAVKRDNYVVVKQLLDIGLDPNVKDNTGNSPLHGVRSLAILDALRHYPFDINVTNSVGESPLIVYVKRVCDDDDANQQQETFLVDLLKAGAKINQADTNGFTALHFVKSVRIARILLEHGAEINAKNMDGETPVLFIFREQRGTHDLLKLLLCNDGLDVLVSAKGNSILSVLVTLSENEMSDILQSFQNRSNFSSLDDLFVLHCNSVDHFDYPVFATAFSEQTNDYCLDKLFDVTQLDVNVHSEYPLLQAAVHNESIIQRLIERGANVNGTNNTKTPLMSAIEARTMVGYVSNFPATALLLAAGADVEYVDQNGDTALKYACRLENRKDARRIISALILAKADYHRCSKENEKLPLMDVEPYHCVYDRCNN